MLIGSLEMAWFDTQFNISFQIVISYILLSYSLITGTMLFALDSLMAFTRIQILVNPFIMLVSVKFFTNRSVLDQCSASKELW